MTNKELQKYLSQWPDNLPIKILLDSGMTKRPLESPPIHDFTTDHILQTSENAYVDDEVDPEEWDCEDGKVIDRGPAYLLFNPIIT